MNRQLPPDPADDVMVDRSEEPAAASIDRAVHALAARATLGLSPAALAAAWSDWALHLATSPGKRADLAEKAIRDVLRYQAFLLGGAATAAAGEDRRFRDEGALDDLGIGRDEVRRREDVEDLAGGEGDDLLVAPGDAVEAGGRWLHHSCWRRKASRQRLNGGFDQPSSRKRRSSPAAAVAAPPSRKA